MTEHKFYVNKLLLNVFLFIGLINCGKEETLVLKDGNVIEEKTIIIDNGDGITLEFLEGLNDNSLYQLPKDKNGYYYLTLDRIDQTLQRLTVKLLKGNEPVYSSYSGYSQKLHWTSNLYWWSLPDDTVRSVTKTYLNPNTGELEYTNLPPISNWEFLLVPTINPSSYTDEDTGIGNIVIGPFPEMIGDTMKVKVEYIHSITQQEEGSSFIDIIGERVIKDSIQIILK
jgi:hypothetical protein